MLRTVHIAAGTAERNSCPPALTFVAMKHGVCRCQLGVANMADKDRETISIVVAGDVVLYRRGLALLLADVDDFEIVGEASCLGEALAALQQNAPQVLLVDMAMSDCLAILRACAEHGPAAVALALPEAEDTFMKCVEAGMAGYVPREASVRDLDCTIRQAAAGELEVSPRLAGTLLRRVRTLTSQLGGPDREYQLTRREMDVALLIAQGKTNKRIASELHIGLATAKNHVHNILRKMGVSRRSEVVIRMVDRHGLPRAPRRPIADAQRTAELR